MTLSLLTLVLKVGCLMGVTPASPTTKPITWQSKLYNIFIFTLLTTGVVLSLMKKGLYNEFFLPKIVVCYFCDICIYGLNFYCILVVHIRKPETWTHLIEGLRSTDDLTDPVLNPKDKRSSKCTFLFLNLLHLATSGYVLCEFGSAYETYFERHTVLHYQIYLEFYQKFLTCVVLNMLKARYKTIKHFLLNNMKAMTRRREFPLSLIKTVEYKMHELRHVVDLYNDIFGWSTFFIIAFTVFEVLNYADYAIFHSFRMTFWTNVVSNIILWSWTLVIALSCSKIYFDGFCFRLERWF
jgi:hypothetical protein